MATIQGVVHGKTIQLQSESGLPDGQAVSVTIQSIDNLPPDFPRVELWLDRLVLDPTARTPTRIVKGTHLSAELLAAELTEGLSDEDMLRAHPELAKEDMVALRHYARWPVGLRLSCGGWADDADELDQYLTWTRQQRQQRREVDE